MALQHSSRTVQRTGITALGSFMFLAVIVVREQFHLSRQFIQNVTFTLSMIRIQYFGFFLLAAFGVLWGFRLTEGL